jgi:acetyltransferase-like isoleucine patch superfamily enzyme
MPDDPRLAEWRRLGARIGDAVFLGPDVFVETYFAPLLTIEDGVVLARGVSIILHDSALNNVLGEPVKFGRVTLRRECYVGANATILCGVEIGERAAIGAGSLVTADVPAGAVAYGHPARVHGTVAELAAKHRALRAKSERFHYLDVAPWREHRDGELAAEADARIASFVAAVPESKRRT